jgi:hypothetical protein
MNYLRIILLIIIFQTLTYVDEKTGKVIETYHFSCRFDEDPFDYVPTVDEFDDKIELVSCTGIDKNQNNSCTSKTE